MIHAIWLGPRRMLPLHEHCLQSWAGYEVRLWDESALADEFGSDLILPVDYPHKGVAGDVFRYQVLRRFGGLYLDVDVELIKPIPQWTLDLGDAVGLESVVASRVGSAVVFARAEGPFIRAVEEQVRASVLAELEKPEPGWMLAAGPPFLTRTVESLPLGQRPVVLGPRHFYPAPPGKSPGEIWPETFAIHHWTKSWGTGIALDKRV